MQCMYCGMLMSNRKKLSPYPKPLLSYASLKAHRHNFFLYSGATLPHRHLGAGFQDDIISWAMPTPLLSLCDARFIEYRV